VTPTNAALSTRLRLRRLRPLGRGLFLGARLEVVAPTVPSWNQFEQFLREFEGLRETA